ncbi:hypothetical protein F511_12982 [Dorcoceras hygrometricum]|uniref:Uncharacterized protein n=1 Tax=Dorcoceras hygrometricum TaxID=472368 RepID=A0A2Z7BMZ9_9LAMI|nr:hypothetical protein F511_12982 [Dorcoceras hygrometricum]
MRSRLERHVYVLIDSYLSKSGSAGLLLLRRFVLYLFRRLDISWKKIVKEATLYSQLPFDQICFFIQVSDLCAWDLVVVIVAQKAMCLHRCLLDVGVEVEGRFRKSPRVRMRRIQRSIPGRRRTRHIDEEVDVLAARVDEMKLIMTRFQRMNP